MQNKPNLLKCQTNLTSALTKDYENKPPLGALRKQTQSNPTCGELVEPVSTKKYPRKLLTKCLNLFRLSYKRATIRQIGILKGIK